MQLLCNNNYKADVIVISQVCLNSTAVCTNLVESCLQNLTVLIIPFFNQTNFSLRDNL